MTLEQITRLGRKLTSFLTLFADCFGRCDARALLKIYVQGQLSNVHRKTAEAIALQFGKAPRTLQRFLEAIKWNEEKLRDRCQQIVARDHAHPEAIGCVDESGVSKSGGQTVGAGRQYNGNRGKIDNCVVGVHLSYSAPGFQVLLDSSVYLPVDWANDPARRKKHTCPRRSSSAPSRRSRWRRSIARWAMGFACRLGRSTNSTAATASFSTGSRHAAKRLWARSRATFTVGCKSRPSCEAGRKSRRKAGEKSVIRAWLDAGRLAKSATCSSTRPCSANSPGSDTASRTPVRGPRYGKSNGPTFGGRIPRACPRGGTA